MSVDARIYKALALLQGAQDLVHRAAIDLSTVPGFGDEWKIVCDLHEQIKGDWHRVEQARETEQARVAKEDANEVT